MGLFLAIFKLGLRYLYRYRRRYGFLMAVLIFGFGIVSFITSTKDGMYDNAYHSAQSHYAGDIVAAGYDTNTVWNYSHRLSQNEITTILNAADKSGMNPLYTVLRTLYSSDAIIHYNGVTVQLKSLVGCDWEAESQLFDRMSFIAPPESLPFMGNDGILLSAPIVRILGVQMGDRVILELETRFNQKNTGFYIVKGIVRDTSIFGYYKAYVSRLSLNRLVAFEDNDCSSIGFFLDSRSSAERKRADLQRVLSEQLQTGPLVYDRDGLARERDRPWEGIRVFLYTMPVYLSEISALLDAMNIITYFIYCMMLIIILVSASVTYRLILNERAREMGVMRAIGFYGGGLALVLWTEIIVLGFISVIAGFVLARLLCWAASFLTFSWFPGFEIFLKNEKLIALFLPGTILINIILLFTVLIMMTLLPSFRVFRKHLPSLLLGEPI